MHSIEYLQSLPKVEVSFQDDFNGTERELTKTPAIILSKLTSIVPTIGAKILLWEKDKSLNNKDYYLCNIAEIIKAAPDIVKIYSSKGKDKKQLVELDGVPVIIEIDRNNYFDVDLNSPLFIN